MNAQRTPFLLDDLRGTPRRREGRCVAGPSGDALRFRKISDEGIQVRSCSCPVGGIEAAFELIRVEAPQRPMLTQVPRGLFTLGVAHAQFWPMQSTTLTRPGADATP
jgi:hypothetical protein